MWGTNRVTMATCIVGTSTYKYQSFLQLLHTELNINSTSMRWILGEGDLVLSKGCGYNLVHSQEYRAGLPEDPLPANKGKHYISEAK